MKRIFRRNQVILTALAIMIAVAGYMNFTREDTKSIPEDTDVIYDISQEDVLAENAADTNEVAQVEGTSQEISQDTTSVEEGEQEKKDASTVGKAILVNNEISPDAIYTAKLGREQERAKNKETLLAVVNDTSATQEMKDKALNEILAMTTNAEMELAAETLLLAKGYENCVVSITEESTDVIVDIEEISQEEAAVIMDAVKRKTGTSSSKIVITPVNSNT